MRSPSIGTIRIREDFRVLIPPLRVDELKQLEANLLCDGCREPLVVWREEMVLLDGHHRHDLCLRHGIPFEIREISLPDAEAVEDWIDRNQLGRRNLTPDQMSLLRGRRYNRAKRQGERTDLTSDQSDQKLGAAERLGAEHGVSAPTIRRDGKYAHAVEALTATTPDLAGRIVSGSAPPRKDVMRAASLLAEEPNMAMAILNGDTSMVDVRRELKRRELVARLEDTSRKEAKAIVGVYDVVVIDPPWPMQKMELLKDPGGVGLDYPTMSVEEIGELRIPAADDCHVWLWTTQKFLPDALGLLEKWGLAYTCTFVWHKVGGYQPLGLPQFNCEFALYARKGTPEFIDRTAFFTCFDAPKRGHSVKPEEFYDVVRRVTAGRRLDMFNRRPIEGFDGWGKEAGEEPSECSPGQEEGATSEATSGVLP